MAEIEFKPTFANNIKLPRGQLFWMSITKPDMAGQYATKKFKASICWPNTPEMKAQLAHIRAAAVKLAKEQPGWGGVDLKMIDLPFRNGDKKVEKSPWLKGMLYLTAKNKNRPTAVGVPTSVDLEETDIYNGMIGRMVVSLMTYESTEQVRDRETGEKVTETARGVTCLLEIVQKLAEGDKLGGGGASRSLLDDDETETAATDDFDSAGEVDESAARGETANAGAGGAGGAGGSEDEDAW